MQEFIIPFMEALDIPRLIFTFLLIFIIIFCVPIAKLISRITAINKTGIEVKSDPNMQRKEKQQDATQELLVSFEKSAVISNVEQKVKTDLLNRKLEVSGSTNEYLINQLAIHVVIGEFEKTYNLIFGSQIFLLKRLNEMSDQGRTEEYIRDYFEHIKTLFPKEFDAWTMEQYLEFMLDRCLIYKQNSTYRITDIGIEYLLWMTRNGRSENKLL